MQLILRVASAVLLVQSVVAFKPAQVPRKIVQLNSLIDEAYDVPSIAQSYSRAAAEVATKVSDVAKGIPKVAKGMPEYDVSEVASKAQSATTEASAKVFSEASAQVSSAVDEFVKAANQNFPAVKSTVSTGLNSAFFKPLLSPLDPSNFPKISPVHPLEAGKAHTLIDYFREKVEDGSFSMKVPDAGTMSDAKSKFALMVSNTYELFGQNAPQTIPALPDGSAGWIATAVVSVVAIGQRNAGVAEAKAAMGDMVKKEASAVSEIAEQLKSMDQQIKQLNKETKALDKELQAAKAKLTQKELALSKERLAAADKELQLNRAIYQLQLKLAEADKKLAAIEKAVRIQPKSPVASLVEEILIEETPVPKKAKSRAKEQPKTVRVVKGATKGANTPAMQSVKGEEAPAKKATAKKAKTTKAAETKAAEIKAAEAKAVETKAAEIKAAEAKAAETKAAETKAAETKAAETKAAEAKAAEAKAAETKAAETKAAEAKAAETMAAATAKSTEAESWSSLSQSTLSRKTVKKLTEYLTNQGVPTTGDDGKILKKALLVEAVQAL